MKMDVKKLVQIAVDKEAELSSEELAARQADKVEGLEVSEDGTVESVEGEKSEILQQLIENFEEMMGDVAASLIAQEMKKNDVDPSGIPEELAERF
jgi:hypothetical protein